jgi:putative ABC transport system substrate-binding protein
LGEEEALKRLELLHELLPAARVMALLVNPADPLAESQVRVSLAAAKTLELELHVLNASIERNFDAAFAKQRNCELAVSQSAVLHFSPVISDSLPR